MGGKRNSNCSWTHCSQIAIGWACRSVLLLLLANHRHLARTTFSWPRARIPFEDDPRLLVDPDQAVALNNARMDLQVRTCIRLVPRRGESDYVFFTDLGPHIECWNMFEPFPPKGRILVNAGTSCLEPMRRPHRPRRVFSDCDIEYINHLYNCPRRRKSSPICPAGRRIMAKPMELQQHQRTTTVAGDDEEEADRTSTKTTTSTTTTTTMAEIEGEDEEGEEGQQGTGEGEGEEGTKDTTERERERETDREEEEDEEQAEVGKGGGDGAAPGQSAEGTETKGVEEPLDNLLHTLSTTSLPNGKSEWEKEAQTVEEVHEVTITHESVEDIATEQSQKHPEMTTMGQEEETMHSTVPTTALPETETTEGISEESTTKTTAKLNLIRTMSTISTNTITSETIEKERTEKVPKMTTNAKREEDELTEESTKPEQQRTSSFVWTTSANSPSPMTWPILTDRTVSQATDNFLSTTQQMQPQTEAQLPLRHPFPLMMTLITTTTTTTIAPPPPDWVRSVEESFRVGNQIAERTVTSSTEKAETKTERRTSSSTSAEEKQKASDEIGAPKPKPIRPESEQSAEEEERPNGTRLVGVVEVPPGGLAIREKTKVTKVIEKTKYIGPCGSACHYDGQLVRLYRSLNNKPSVMDHFYTTERLEQHLMAAQGYVMEPTMGFLGRNQIDPNCTCIRPLYRLFSEFANDHFLTASEQEKSIAEGLLGYVHQRILGYCTNEPGCGAYVPLYRFFSAVNRDHFYTADQQEMHYYKTHAELTYAFEKIECYVWQHSSSARGCPAVPLLDEREQRRDVKRDDFRRQR